MNFDFRHRIQSLLRDGPPLTRYYPLFLMAFLGYAIADIAALSVRSRLLPREAPAAVQLQQPPPLAPTFADYRPILDRNILNWDGKMPPPLGREKETPMATDVPVPTTLPLKLMGTIVHFRPELSVATIQDSSVNRSYPMKVEDEIENRIRVTKIERRRVYFLNLNSRRTEYVEIPEDATITFGLQEQQDKPGTSGAPAAQSFEFTVRRNEVEAHLADLPNVLRQALMAPVTVGNEIVGFRFQFIQPGSVYEKLGFRTGDVLKSVMGERLDNPMKGMQLFNRFRNESSISLVVERDGREETFQYQVN